MSEPKNERPATVALWCPQCGKTALALMDENYPKETFEIHCLCSKCGPVVTMKFLDKDGKVLLPHDLP